jgi:hypothetical protein
MLPGSSGRGGAESGLAILSIQSIQSIVDDDKITNTNNRSGISRGDVQPDTAIDCMYFFVTSPTRTLSFPTTSGTMSIARDRLGKLIDSLRPHPI